MAIKKVARMQGLRSGLAIVLGGAVLAAPPVLAQVCEDRDLDGFFSEIGCGTLRDCNDADGGIFPGAAEACDGRDGDCNGLVDDAGGCDRTCDNPERFAVVQQVSQDPVNYSDRGNVVWVGDGWVVAYLTFWQDACAELLLQKLDPEGNPIGGPVTVSGGAGIRIAPREPWLIWTGSEVVLSWRERETEFCLTVGAVHARIQRYNGNLQPIGAGVELGCPAFPGGFSPRTAWTGSRYGAFWNRTDGARFTTLSRDGVPFNPCGVLVTGSDFPEFNTLAWNGTEFGASWTEIPPEPGVFSEVYFRRIGEDMTLLDPAPIRETFDPARTAWDSLTWADGEWAISWAEDRDAPNLRISEIYLMRLDALGNKVDPPGDIRVTCCNTDADGFERWWNRLLWTGEEFGLGYHENNHPTSLDGDVFFQRVDASGNKIGAPVSLTPGSMKFANHVDMDWNGTEYGVVWDDAVLGTAPRQVFFGRVGCNCTDVDGDQFTTCAGGDCDDGNPLIHPLQSEFCLNAVDDDCDKLADCQDPTACPADAGAVPPEIAGLGFDADAETLTWQPEPAADVYDLLRGDLTELRADGDFSRAACLTAREPATSHRDPTLPAAGSGMYYLVRGKADLCRLGTWGSTLRDGAAMTCP